MRERPHTHVTPAALLGLAVAFLAAASVTAREQAPAVAGHAKISATEGGFDGVLDPDDAFGAALAAGPDLDGNGTPDLAVGASLDGDGGMRAGAVWLVRLSAAGTVVAHTKISATAGGFGGLLDEGDQFGSSLAWPGDVNGDGTPDLVVGAQGDDDGGLDVGGVWVLFLAPDGSVRSHTKVGAAAGGFTGTLDPRDLFGAATAPLGDLDRNGVPDLAVGAYNDDDGGLNRGAVWLLFLLADGSVRAHTKISATAGGFTGPLDNGDAFGRAVVAVGDLDGDGLIDLAVGAEGDDDGGPDRGAVWILFLDRDGTVKGHQKISATAGGFTGLLAPGDRFGSALAAPGDLDGDGTPDLLVGASGSDDGGTERGSAWIVLLAPDGTVRCHRKISATEGGFTGGLDDGDRFGWALAAPGDIDGDGAPDVTCAAVRDDDGGPPESDRGAVWILMLDACPADLDDDGAVAFGDLLAVLAAWGPCAACSEDLDASGAVDLADLLAMLASWGPCPG